jgi:hypothetical protein
VRRRILAVAEIVIARQEPHRQAETIVQAPRRGEIADIRGAVEGHVARVQDHVRAAPADRLADAPEIVDEERLVVAEVGVGDVGDAEGHACSLVLGVTNA